ncbi:hypothetical protein [Chitinophaga sp.]|uniref:hypothetical protein n=1 Tax=Chitinophaga sp. TaxID=1869181 RepID=UPI0031E214C5
MIARIQFLLLVGIAMPLFLRAQDSTQTTKTDTRRNVFTANLDFQSRISYYGRTDSLKSSLLNPSIGYQLKMGLYAQASMIFINNPVHTLDYTATVLEGGYRFGQNKKVSGNIFYNQYLYEKDTRLIQSVVKSQTGFNVAFETKVITFNINGNLKFSDKTDVGAAAGLDHLFLIRYPKKHAAIGINPTAYAYFGTQNFSKTYYEQKKLFNIIPTQPEVVTKNSEQFNILSYEFSLPVVFVYKHFNCSLSGTYVLPQHLISGVETGSNMFYFSAGLGLRI